MDEDMVKLPLPSDETEFIETRPFPFAGVIRMVRSAEIMDSMTITAVLHAAQRKS